MAPLEGRAGEKLLRLLEEGQVFSLPGRAPTQGRCRSDGRPVGFWRDPPRTPRRGIARGKGAAFAAPSTRGFYPKGYNRSPPAASGSEGGPLTGSSGHFPRPRGAHPRGPELKVFLSFKVHDRGRFIQSVRVGPGKTCARSRRGVGGARFSASVKGIRPRRGTHLRRRCGEKVAGTRVTAASARGVPTGLGRTAASGARGQPSEAALRGRRYGPARGGQGKKKRHRGRFRDARFREGSDPGGIKPVAPLYGIAPGKTIARCIYVPDLPRPVLGHVPGVVPGGNTLGEILARKPRSLAVGNAGAVLEGFRRTHHASISLPSSVSVRLARSFRRHIVGGRTDTRLGKARNRTQCVAESFGKGRRSASCGGISRRGRQSVRTAGRTGGKATISGVEERGANDGPRRGARPRDRREEPRSRRRSSRSRARSSKVRRGATLASTRET